MTSSSAPVLVLPPRYSEDSISLSQAALSIGWHVERLTSWRAPEWLQARDVVLYAEPLFAEVVKKPLGIALLEPRLDWLPSLPSQYLQRSVQLTTLGQARSVSSSAFIKPADDKCFTAGIYASGAELPFPEGLEEETPVYVAEPVQWLIEHRCFVLNRCPVTSSVYMKNGIFTLSQTEPEREEALAFARSVLDDEAIPFPPAVVLDVGQIKGKGWAIVECNAAWGSGIYGCDPVAILPILRRCCVKIDKVTDPDREWIMNRTTQRTEESQDS